MENYRVCCGAGVQLRHCTRQTWAAKAVLARVVRCTERGQVGGDPEN